MPAFKPSSRWRAITGTRWDEVSARACTVRCWRDFPIISNLSPTPETVVPEALALGNTMIALGKHRRYAFHSVGALGVIEMTAPTRAGYVNEGLKRLGDTGQTTALFRCSCRPRREAFAAWNREVLRPLVDEDPRRAQAIGEGAIMRLWHGARTFARYRSEFNIRSRTKSSGQTAEYALLRNR